MISRLVLASVLPVLLLAALPGRPDTEPLAASTMDFVLDTPSKALLVRVHLEMDGRPFAAAQREAQKEYLAALFRFLDRNGDGFLDEAEARAAPLPLVRLPEIGGEDVHIAYNFKALDADGDGKVSSSELAGFYHDFEGGPFQVRAGAGAPANGQLGDALFALLDTDRDGRLSRQEIARAADMLAKLDSDNNEVLIPGEIAPDLFPRGDGATRPPVMVAPVRVPDVLTTDPARLKSFAGREPDLEVRVRLGALRPGVEPLEVLRHATGKTEGEVNRGGARIALRCDRSWLSPKALDGLRRHYQREFRAADMDGDGILNPAEARRRPLFRELFSALDRDGDGKVSAAEMMEHVERVLALQARAMSRQATLLVSHPGAGLWDLLDRNRDGVLGLREVRAAPALLASLDRNGDGFVSRDEILPSFLLQFGPGETSFSRLSGEEVVTPDANGRLNHASGVQGGGPLWFRKMDANGDGDVSRREFLGSPEEFRKLDRDGDGLISREEAEQAETRARSKN